MSSQKPCGKTFEISTAEMSVPSGTDVIGVSLDQDQHSPKLSIAQAIILRQSYLRLKPEFRFPIRALHVYMSSKFLAGEEVQPVVRPPSLTHIAQVRGRWTINNLVNPKLLPRLV